MLQTPWVWKSSRLQLTSLPGYLRNGYGQASYICLVSVKGRTHCILVTGKARAAPLKYISIPKMELVAATLSVSINNLDY